MGGEIARQQRLASMPQAAVDVAGLEERLGARLFIWIGGIALALAGAFLVKYSIDQGWLGPAVRCAFGVALGVALLGAGEWMRSREGRIAQSLSAAGVAVLYASLFASVRLYHLIDPAFGFLALAGLTAAAPSRWRCGQGQFVALLGTGRRLRDAAHRPQRRAPCPRAVRVSLRHPVRQPGADAPARLVVAIGDCGRRRLPVGRRLDRRRAARLEQRLSGWRCSCLATSAAAAWTQRARAVPERLESWTPADWQGPTTHALALVAMTGLVAAAGYDLYGWLFFGLARGRMVGPGPDSASSREPLARARCCAGGVAAGRVADLRPSPSPPTSSRFIGVALSISALFACGGFGALWGARQPVRWALFVCPEHGRPLPHRLCAVAEHR